MYSPNRLTFGNRGMNESQFLKILEPMMAGFRREIADLRKAGASQAEIDAMVGRFEEIYAPDDEVVALLRETAK